MQAFPRQGTRFLGLWKDCSPDIEGLRDFDRNCWTFGGEACVGASDTVLTDSGGRGGKAFSPSTCLPSAAEGGDGNLGFVDEETSIVGSDGKNPRERLSCSAKAEPLARPGLDPARNQMPFKAGLELVDYMS